MAYTDLNLYIDGEFTKGNSGVGEDVLNPASDAVLAHLPHAKKQEMDLALAAAERAFKDWKKTPVVERSKILRKAAELMRERVDQISEILTLEQGKVRAEAKIEVMACAEVIEWFAEEGRRAYGRIIPPRADGVRQMVLMEPVGVVAGFCPWNFPIMQAVRKIAGSLAAGCTIVCKCPEETPGSPIEMVKCFHDAGLPKGCLHMLYGTPAELSEYMIPHPTVRKVSFTGSVPVGKHLAAIAGQHMKRITMELGGHSPMMIFDDVDAEHVANVTSALKWRNAGQVCISPTRFLVHEKVYDQFVSKFTDLAKNKKVGDGLDPDSEMGPLANPRRIDAMEQLVADAQEQGGKVTTGGSRIGNQGNFFEPTVLEDVPQSARIMNEEPFGPVAVMVRFKDEDAMLEEANRLPFGLASYAFTHDAKRVSKIADGIEAGMLSVNHHGIALPETPFGGVKDSGFGHEGGIEGLQAYMQAKMVSHLG